MFLLLWTTEIIGGLSTVLVATGPNLSELKSTFIGATSNSFLGEGSGAKRGYLITTAFPGCKPNGAEVPIVIRRALPSLSGETCLSSNCVPFTRSILYCSCLSSVPSISMEISSVFGVSKIPGISSRTRRTLISEVPVFSRVITVSTLDEMYDFIRDLSNLF